MTRTSFRCPSCGELLDSVPGLDTGAVRCPRCGGVVRVPEGRRAGAPAWWKVALASLLGSVLGIVAGPAILLVILMAASAGGGGGGGLGAAFALMGYLFLGAAAGFLSGLLIPWFWYASILRLGPRRSCGLWLGAVAGTFVAAGFIGLSPFLADYQPDENKLLLFLGTIGCLVLAASVGLTVARRPGSRMFAGVLGGFLAGVPLAGALAGLAIYSAMGQVDRRDALAKLNQVPTDAGRLFDMPPMADIVPFSIYGLTAFTAIGAVLGRISRRDWRIRPVSDSVRMLWPLPVLVLWGPLLGFLCQRLERPRESRQAEVSKTAEREGGAVAVTNKWLAIYMQYNGALEFNYQHWHSGMQNSTTKQLGEAGSVFSDSTSGISGTLAWPAPRTFELAVHFDSKVSRERLKVSVIGNFPRNLEARLDEARVVLPTEVPPGEHRLVIRGDCPAPVGQLGGPSLGIPPKASRHAAEG